MSTYLVLGASGFLGSHVVEAITGANQADELITVSRRCSRSGSRRRDGWVSMDLEAATVDDLVALLDAARPDVVVNCVGRVWGSEEELRALNTTLVAKLASALTLSGPSTLIHLGSAAEYGAQPQGLSIRETATPRPVGAYGRTKLEATRLLTRGFDLQELRGCVLRVFNPVGPRAPAESLAGRAARLMRVAIHAGQTSVTLGNLGDFRDFLAASDVAEVVLRSVGTYDEHPILNVGKGVALSCRTLVELLADAADFDGEIFEDPGENHHLGSVPWQQADTGLLRSTLGWVPTTPIAQALADLWNEGE